MKRRSGWRGRSIHAGGAGPVPRVSNESPPRGRNRWPLAVLVPFLAMSPSVALAYRPFFSTDAAVANAGEVEVEVGYAAFRQNGNGTTIVAPALIANLGVARALELVGEFRLVNDLDGGDREPMRFEDSAISLKWVAREGVFQERGPAPSLAVEMSVLLPTLRGEDRPGGELVGIASARALGWTYHLNGGPLVEPGGDDLGAVWGVILEHGLTDSLRAVAEVNGRACGAAPRTTARSWAPSGSSRLRRRCTSCPSTSACAMASAARPTSGAARRDSRSPSPSGAQGTKGGPHEHARLTPPVGIARIRRQSSRNPVYQTLAPPPPHPSALPDPDVPLRSLK